MSMGIAKHRKSGKAPKSPKLRYALKLMAEGHVSDPLQSRPGKNDARRVAWRRKRDKR